MQGSNKIIIHYVVDAYIRDLSLPNHVCWVGVQEVPDDPSLIDFEEIPNNLNLVSVEEEPDNLSLVALEAGLANLNWIGFEGVPDNLKAEAWLPEMGMCWIKYLMIWVE